jgi:hypothetical protein
MEIYTEDGSRFRSYIVVDAAFDLYYMNFLPFGRKPTFEFYQASTWKHPRNRETKVFHLQRIELIGTYLGERSGFKTCEVTLIRFGSEVITPQELLNKESRKQKTPYM